MCYVHICNSSENPSKGRGREEARDRHRMGEKGRKGQNEAEAAYIPAGFAGPALSSF